MVNEANREFRWLSISDVHVGLPAPNWLWPGLKGAFYDDLARLYDRAGPWHAVLFSGDVAQSGSAADFCVATDILLDLWSNFDRLGVQPALFVIPGNHDVRWPSAERPETVALRQYWTEEAVRESFWKPNSTYLAFINEVLNDYSEWELSLSSAGIPLLSTNAGLLPGDKVARVPVGDGHVGIIGLNSTWLQIGSGDYQGKLHVDPR